MKKKNSILFLAILAISILLCACGSDSNKDEFVPPSSVSEACELADVRVNNLNDGSNFEIYGYYDEEECLYCVIYECPDAKMSLTVSGWTETEVDSTLGYAYRKIAPCFEVVEVPVLTGLYDNNDNLLFIYDGTEIIDNR